MLPHRATLSCLWISRWWISLRRWRRDGLLLWRVLPTRHDHPRRHLQAVPWLLVAIILAKATRPRCGYIRRRRGRYSLPKEARKARADVGGGIAVAIFFGFL